jgi:hypothetical protein
MKVLLLNGSANKNGNTFYCIIDYPEREEWQGMNFIR